ncbi:MAG: hypothetical protein ACHQF0_03390 [Chitinophagales bacterium]
MKFLLPFIILLYNGLTLTAQDKKAATDSVFHYRGLTKEECPQQFLTYINNDSLQSKAVLLVLNESLHPLGRYEFFDDVARVRSLRMPMRMNRCSLLYIDTGMHRYRTVYQQLKVSVQYEAGKIYLAHLFSRANWPFGGISVIRKNDKGEPVEYAAVLFEYINTATATELYGRMNKKEMLVNE